ncbi:hypothetical protein BDP27DRAFT_1368541 [Rhodocollybia butyracea]|uniref:SUN domain-containing protein n=1 Tax=Rhodocollybia butyracea TaxID=206335 RepID=A0A9P5PHN5_9AGAR|nr:hypothetical protein BDP27DRAFT_1368541 [Rhodocollybia butyracea]
MTHPENESGPSSRANPTVTHPRLTAATKMRTRNGKTTDAKGGSGPTLEMDATSSSELSRDSWLAFLELPNILAICAWVIEMDSIYISGFFSMRFVGHHLQLLHSLICATIALGFSASQLTLIVELLSVPSICNYSWFCSVYQLIVYSNSPAPLYLAVKLARGVRLTNVTVYYPDYRELPSWRQAEAPKLLRIWALLPPGGYQSTVTLHTVSWEYFSIADQIPKPMALEDGSKFVQGGVISYDIAQPGTKQTFSVDLQFRTAVVIVEVLDNWGATTTCLHRLAVHGEEPPELSVKHGSGKKEELLSPVRNLIERSNWMVGHCAR